MIAAGLAGAACDILPRAGDTEGVQHSGGGAQPAGIVGDTDPTYPLVRLRVDTTIPERHDVVLARFDFDPSDALGDEYSLDVALDLGDARRLTSNRSYSLGDSIPAHATVACLCRPLRPDSVRGTYAVQTRG